MNDTTSTPATTAAPPCGRVVRYSLIALPVLLLLSLLVGQRAAMATGVAARSCC
jgi:hypothetical protein